MAEVGRNPIRVLISQLDAVDAGGSSHHERKRNNKLWVCFLRGDVLKNSTHVIFMTSADEVYYQLLAGILVRFQGSVSPNPELVTSA